ncbi:hypothetical protein CHUAL_002187 [Chamberlinius hualienensis]
MMANRLHHYNKVVINIAVVIRVLLCITYPLSINCNSALVEGGYTMTGGTGTSSSSQYQQFHRRHNHHCAQQATINHHSNVNNNIYNNRTLVLGVILPDDSEHPFSKKKVLPAIKSAVQLIMSKGDSGPLPRWNITILDRDSQCSSMIGPLAAFDLYHRQLVHAFFGPVCTYVLAPVARYNTIWRLPLLTAGGQTDHFDSKMPQYKYLTRMNGSYSQIGHIFINILAKFGWRVLGFLYHNSEHRNVGHSACHFSLAAVFLALGKTATHKAFDENNSKIDYKMLLHNISKTARNFNNFKAKGEGYFKEETNFE